MSPRQRLAFSLLLIVTVFLAGTVGYMLIERADDGEGPTFGEAAYMTVITISTVGYTEVWPLTSRGRAWTICVIVFGIGTASYAGGSLIALIVGGELRSHRERHRMEKKLEHLSGHVILCGYGRMGRMIAERLSMENQDVVVIESDDRYERELTSLGIPYIIADATDEDELLRAGVERAGALVAALPSDADNVYITLTSYTLNPKLHILARAEQPRTEPKLKRAGATRVICPQVIGATKIASLITQPMVVDFIETVAEGVSLEMDEFVIEEGSPLSGTSLKDSGIRDQAAASVVAIKQASGATLYNPGPNAELSVGDTLILVGEKGMAGRLSSLTTSA